MYRLMLLDKNRCGILIIPTQHSGLLYRKYESRGLPMPYTACIGLDPTIHVGAAASLPAGSSEAEVIGGVRGEPLRLVKCETNDLMVPAGAEIVLEGEVLPNVREPEGPFGEYQGYSVHGKAPMPVFQVNAITTRKNPILTIVCEGMPVTMGHTVANVVIVAEIYKELLRQALPVVGIYSPPWSCTDLLVVAIKSPHGGLPQRVASAVWGTKSGMFFNKIMVTNDDIDPTNLNQVINSFSTKCHPGRGIHVMDGAWNIPLTPYLSPAERRTQRGANVLFDCTFPPEWGPADTPVKSDFESIFPQEIQQKVLSRWKDYGFKS
jgi:4-hydroxy-3-polyprenylbenzoate decarboxylase